MRSNIDDIRLRDWVPQCKIRLPSTDVAVARFHCIDVHNHLGRWLSKSNDWVVEDPASVVQMMDAANIETIVNLDGMWGDELEANLDRYDRAFPGRFLTFCQIDWARLREPNGVHALVAQLEESSRRGARGVKVWKDLGLSIRDASSRLILPDAPDVITVIRAAGELGMPVLIHSADPMAFFDPLDEQNERLDELRGGARGWLGDRSIYPSFDALLRAHERLVLESPRTTFIGAHVGCNAEDLDRVERLLAAAPHYNVDIAGRLGELGRQPRRFRRMVQNFPDRVLFGTDAYPPAEQTYAVHYRFLESEDEWFDYDPFEPIPPQGRWAISAAALDDELLRSVYYDNARRVLGL